ncbi:MAG: hypothetical protein GY856_08465 [bacterium]|nr:hypothetical protein [bacterium]
MRDLAGLEMRIVTLPNAGANRIVVHAVNASGNRGVVADAARRAADQGPADHDAVAAGRNDGGQLDGEARRARGEHGAPDDLEDGPDPGGSETGLPPMSLCQFVILQVIHLAV